MANDVIAKIRHFNRFYTNILGLLNKGILDSPYSLSEVRLMLEIEHMERCTFAKLIGLLNIDKGLASRLISRLSSDGIVVKERSPEDKRVEYLSLTAGGRQILAGLDGKSNDQIAVLIQNLTAQEQQKLVESMEYIAGSMGAGGEAFCIRPYRPEDVGYVIARHREMYRKDYGFKSTFGDYVQQTVSAFHENRDDGMEQMWIAERGGEPMGAIAIVRAADSAAQLRWFFVEPEARGKGVGGSLIDTALGFCRERKYSSVLLWTTDILKAARKMYAAHGFRLTQSVGNDTWTDGTLLEEKWELEL